MKRGRPAIRPQASKLASICIAELRQADLLHDGRSKLIRWTNGIEVLIRGGSESIVLGQQRVRLVETPANLGGMQRWLQCVVCHTKRLRLFLHEGLWACKDCHRIATAGQLCASTDKVHRELARYAERAATLPAWRLKRSAHRIPKLIDKLKGMK